MDKPQQDRLSIGEASRYLNVAIETLRRWDKKGKIESYRSPGGHRYFSRKDLKKLFKKGRYQRIKKKDKSLLGTKRATEKITVVVNESCPENGFSKRTKKLKKRITKNLPIRKMFLFLLVFFAAVDIVLILFYFFARNLVFPIPYF
ncbi:helix-turn-helix domain-containing protein [Candidatus Woesebacteria bacterium]|nr:helix-turn-helix domain-containing protein [Candidatus Woesebacteria bacterium]